MKFRLTKNNYYSAEANQRYWSASLVKTFLDCPARAVAELNGEWNPPMNEALLVGSYVDAAFEGPKSFDRFKAEHPEVMNKRDGTPKAPFKKADEMISRAKSDPVFMEYMKGRKQTIKTGTVFGLPFKAKFDSYRKGERITDLKTVRDMAPTYMPEMGRVSPVQRWRWDIQMALYSAIEGNDLPTYLAIVTKESPPDLYLIEISKAEREACMSFLEQKMPMFDAMKRGIIEPTRCECCEYCRATKKLTGPITLTELEFNNYE
jgi:hypothetical protein